MVCTNEGASNPVPDRILTRRELNRALLARQMLLERQTVSAREAVRRLAGMQAQIPNPPYIGLWSRLRDFQREELTQLIQQKQVVRATAMRHTLHLLTAEDYLRLRLAIQPALTRGWQTITKTRLQGLDVERVVETARAYVTEQPRTFVEIRDLLAKLEPERDPSALAYTARTFLPLIQIPPAGTWDVGGSATQMLVEDWLGQPLVSAEEGLPELIRRYLAAFGPATVGDIQSWSYLSGLKGAVEQLRPELRTFRDERKRELFDLPDAPLPDADTPAPVRFLPEFDNLILSHDDRSRVLPNEYRKNVFLTAARVRATFLVDGFVAGAWKFERVKKAARLIIEPYAPLADAVRDELAQEGGRLLRFAEDDATGFEVMFAEIALCWTMRTGCDKMLPK